jgi:hypothetical protein
VQSMIALVQGAYVTQTQTDAGLRFLIVLNIAGSLSDALSPARSVSNGIDFADRLALGDFSARS